MNIVLIHPPLDDPTLPYHSTAYLVGHLRANGFQNVAMRDINIEFVNYVLSSAAIHDFYEEAERRLTGFGNSEELKYPDQEAYYGLLSAPRIDPSEITRAAAALKCKETFLDFGTYVQSVNTLTGYFAFLGALSYPADNRGFMPATRGRFSVASIRDLMDGDLATKACWPFTRYFYRVMTADKQLANADLIGISIVYDHQLYHALHLARLVKQVWPSKKVILGGTAITQLYKYLRDKDKMKAFFGITDAIVVGEGETAICEIASSNGDLERKPPTNTIVYSRANDKVTFPDVRYENVSALGSPCYDHPWELYLSPERGVNYSPTRGCYWNRCTFCDYGLNTDKPTSPWRERKVEQVVADLRTAQQDHGVKYFYFAVDVMAPGYLERISDALLDADLKARWAAELRMEKIFSPERAIKMAKAGCVCVSFGMESGDQRILDLIDKGTRVDYMGATLKNFASSGIACQLMGFTDFPTETPTEKAATFEFIRKNEEYWSSGGLGTFMLTGTSAIAKNPAKFGITLIETQDADIHKAIAYRVNTETESKLSLTEEADASFDSDGGIFPPVLGRPWAGGIDSLHSMIYYDRYGRNFFKTHAPEQTFDIDEIRDEEVPLFSVVVHGRPVECQFDFARVLENRRLFISYLKDRITSAALPTFSTFAEWCSTLPALNLQDKPNYWLVLGKDCVRLDKTVYHLLRIAAANPLTMDAILSRATAGMRSTLISYFKELEANGFISFRFGDRLIKHKRAPGPELVVHRTSRDAPQPPWRFEGEVNGTAAKAKIEAAPLLKERVV